LSYGHHSSLFQADLEVRNVSSHKTEKTARNKLVENVCPKCGAPKSSYSCDKCGLIFAKYIPSAEGEPALGLLELWEYVESNWKEAAAHAVFIERAFALNQPAFAARCYRQKGDDPVASTRLAAIVTRLEQAMYASKTEPRQPPSASRIILAAALFILAASVGALLVMSRLR
jgi:hypothetical protein